jgi:hypothetical protein
MHIEHILIRIEGDFVPLESKGGHAWEGLSKIKIYQVKLLCYNSISEAVAYSNLPVLCLCVCVRACVCVCVRACVHWWVRVRV